MLQGLLDRFLASVSFAAHTRLVAALAVDAMMRGGPEQTTTYGDGTTNIDVNGGDDPLSRPLAFSLSGVLIPLAVAGTLLCAYVGAQGPPSFKGLQSVFGLLAGQGLAYLLPIPAEPSFLSVVLALPNLLLYFGTIAAIGASTDRLLSLALPPPSPLPDAVGAIFQQYTSLFATARALHAFRFREHRAMLALLSTVYMLLPDRVVPGTAPPPGGGAFWGVWYAHFVSCMEALTVRASMLSLGRALTWWAGRSHGDEALVVLYLLTIRLLAAPPFVGLRKLDQCRSMLSLLCAQHCVGVLLDRVPLSTTTVLLLWLALLALFLVLSLPDGNDVCSFALSFLLVRRLERLLAGFGALEACTAYMCLFALLECLRSDPWSGPQATTSSALFFAQGAGNVADELPFAFATHLKP